uniref:ubiquitinyl hydrolase 1 n=1 Tax=Chromera velia CCMP2878 TaxID=1169474 RepID=A0A0G4G6D4_9ALVE|eukprot:Cvel_4219.t1-p1 / transcript=Cvel_4219.t1 / gene=Cvel_4219 / organism=Chromera_velia_CCMP2878 / gene_product=E3 ubiquitin-protein ligase MIB2, putative / transcript_product=E3 ubiquitin-protein ligase MIB2, putative / location=Cvel_scaffold182:56177-80736(+) / protein_length=5757 / sequence_SO=supercontig / SO=protein_coding / is_pseudo=false
MAWMNAFHTRLPIWDSAENAFKSEFCSTFLLYEYTTVPHTDTNAFCNRLENLLDRLEQHPMPEVRELLPLLDDFRAAIDPLREIVRKLTVCLFRNLEFHIPKAIDSIIKLVDRAQEGEVIILPVFIEGNCCFIVGKARATRPGRTRAQDLFDCAIVNPSYFASFHPASVSSPPKFKRVTALPLTPIPRSRLASQAWWLVSLAGYSKEQRVMYGHMLPWLTGKSWEESFILNDGRAVFRSCCANSASTYKALMHALKYVVISRNWEPPSGDSSALAQAPSSVAEVPEPWLARLVHMEMRFQFMRDVIEEVRQQESLSSSEKRQIAFAIQSSARALDRLAHRLPFNQLQALSNQVDEDKTALENAPVGNSEATPPPPALDIQSNWGIVRQAVLFPFMDAHRRLESTEPFAGAAVALPAFVPSDPLTLPDSARTLEEAVRALENAVFLCVRWTCQDSVKNKPFLIYALICHLAIEILPPAFYSPPGEDTDAHAEGQGDGEGDGAEFSLTLTAPSSAAKGIDENGQNCKLPAPPANMQAGVGARGPCVWWTPMKRGTQLRILMRLSQICELFVTALFSLTDQEGQEGLRAVVLGAFAAIADCVLRQIATDEPSPVSRHFAGLAGPPEKIRTSVYGTGPGKFALKTENTMISYAEALACRSWVLDYFEAVAANVPPSFQLFRWELGMAGFDDAGAKKFVRQLATTEGFPTSVVMYYVTGQGEYSLLVKYMPEFMYLRDVHFWFKHVHTDGRNKVPIKTWRWAWNDGQLSWSYDAGGLPVTNVAAFGRRLDTVAGGAKPSFATAARFTFPNEATTEDDILHIPNLPTFENVLGQRDSELLLSYLTAPYLRVPLVLHFFAHEDRVSCLLQRDLQKILFSCLFEPGKFLPMALQDTVPQFVPAENPALLATPCGLLLNELQFSASGVIGPLLRLVTLAQELDAGTVHNESTVTLILFLLRLVARVENYLVLLLSMAAGLHPSVTAIRGVRIDATALGQLREAYRTVRTFIEGPVQRMIDSWMGELLADDDDVDATTAKCARLHAHLVVLQRNALPDDLDLQTVSVFLSSLVFLTTRHTWNSTKTGIDVTEPELFEAFHHQRRAMVSWLVRAAPEDRNAALDGAVRVATSTGVWKGPAAHDWGLVGGPNSVGRFTRVDRLAILETGPSILDAYAKDGIFFPAKGMQVVKDGHQDVEINVATGSLTFKSSHLRALPEHIVKEPDIETVFLEAVGGKSHLLASMQCAIVADTEHRQWVRLVGQEHDVFYWKTPDPRLPMPSYESFRFFPDDCTRNEAWLVAIVEPIRRQFFDPGPLRPPIFLLLPETPAGADTDCVRLDVVESRSARKTHEIIAIKPFNVAHVYQIFSWGRRWHRELSFTSDARYTLAFSQPSTDHRPTMWTWDRHFAQRSTEGEHSHVVIVRHPNHPRNLSKSAEMYVPKGTLEGLLPGCLLETHLFWQDQDDNMRGYPWTSPWDAEGEVKKKDDKKKEEEGGEDEHVLWLHWQSAEPLRATGHRSISYRVFRFPDKRMLPKPSEQGIEASIKALFASKEAKEDAEDDTEETNLANIRPPNADLALDEDEENAERTEGLFREASLAQVAARAATAEDHPLLLVNLLYAKERTPLHSLARVLVRLEPLSHILCWTRQLDYDVNEGGRLTLDLVQLPRLKLSFSARVDSQGNVRLWSLDHAHLFVSNNTGGLVSKLLQGIPHSLVLSDAHGTLNVLVPAFAVVRPRISAHPFSTELVVDRADQGWYEDLDTRYYLYRIHVSLSFLFTPTLASGLYLLLLRLLNRNYSEVFRLAGTIGTDTTFTQEESDIFNSIAHVADAHPDAAACAARMSLVVADAPVAPPWYLPEVAAIYLLFLPRISVSCRMTATEETRLMSIASALRTKMELFLREAKDLKEEYQALMNQVNAGETALLSMTLDQRKNVQIFTRAVSQKVFSALGVRIKHADVVILAHVQQSINESDFCSCGNPRTMSEEFITLIENRLAFLIAEKGAISENPEAASGYIDTAPSFSMQLQQIPKIEPWDPPGWSKWDLNNIRLPGTSKEKNDEGRTLELGRNDLYYCNGSNVRKGLPCRCTYCGDACCPCSCLCPSCERFNKNKAPKTKELPDYSNFSLYSLNKRANFFEMWDNVQATVYGFNFLQSGEEPPPPPQESRISLREWFVLFYEMISGSLVVKIANSQAPNCAADFPSLLFPFLREFDDVNSAVGYVMHWLLKNENSVKDQMPKWNRAERNPGKQLRGIYQKAIGLATHAGDPSAAPVMTVKERKEKERQDRLKEKAMEKEREKNQEKEKEKEPEWKLVIEHVTLTSKVRPLKRTPAEPLTSTRVVPLDVGVGASRRRVNLPDTSLLALDMSDPDAVGNLYTTEDDLEFLTEAPLGFAYMNSSLVQEYEPKDIDIPDVSSKLPFEEISNHPVTHPFVAKEMLDHLRDDMKEFAAYASAQRHKRLQGLHKLDAVQKLLPGSPGAPTARAEMKKSLEDLRGRVLATRDNDSNFLSAALPLLSRSANDISLGTLHNDSTAKLRVALRRTALLEAELSLELILAAIVDEDATNRWIQLNPLLTEERCEALVDLVTLVLLRANRIGQANRVAEHLDALIDLIVKAGEEKTEQPGGVDAAFAAAAAAAVSGGVGDRVTSQSSHASAAHPLVSDGSPVSVSHRKSSGHANSAAGDALAMAILQKAEAAVLELTAPRVYMQIARRTGAERNTTYDPRLLLFEFIWSIVLRRQQYELVVEIHSALTEGRPLVKQMIMGAGKTTVVGPLLALMMADGNALVVQVVPPALLYFSRSILRATFSVMIQKLIFTFQCERASDIDAETVAKFDHARTSRGVVVSTPSAVKSAHLKFLETLDKIEDRTRPRHRELEDDAKALARLMRLWQEAGVLVMDEVDLLLHPLKSELNFPIGAKHTVDFAPFRWKLPTHLVDAVFFPQTKRVASAMRDVAVAREILDQFAAVVAEGLQLRFLQETPHITLLNRAFYDEKMKPLLARWTVVFLRANHFTGLDDESTLTYILERPEGYREKLSTLDESHIKMLNLAYDHLSSFIPHVLQKVDRVSYGILNESDQKRLADLIPSMPQSRLVLAIPFIGKDLPSSVSEFAHPDVVIALTLLAYRYEGLRQSDFQAVMQQIVSDVEKEAGRFAHRKTNILYERWVAAAGGRILRKFNYGADKDKDKKEKEDALVMQPSEHLQLAGESAVVKGDEDGMAFEGGAGFRPVAVSAAGEPGGSASMEAFLDNYNAASGVGAGRSISGDANQSMRGVSSDRPAPGQEVLPLWLFKQGNRDERDKIFKLLRRCPDVIHWYLHEIVFPNHMQHQVLKLSASGQELGGAMIFPRRVGFSGTPSNLMPVELGPCSFEHMTDAKIIWTMTNPVICRAVPLKPNWRVSGVLTMVANAQPPYHALIDTGALITGLSNLEVAQYLLRKGLKSMEGVVFLDDEDRKMILVRATGRVLKLAECGIPKIKRFAFYDQVHTTGMDIEHTPNAVAALTVGKDMTFRDYAQGAYRMRGIGSGQRIDVLLIPEVVNLITRTLDICRGKGNKESLGQSGAAAAAMGDGGGEWAHFNPFAHSHTHAQQRQALVEVLGWLVVNSMRSERTQHSQLCIQNIHNVPRKAAFKRLLQNVGNFKVQDTVPKLLVEALGVFREKVGYEVALHVPKAMMFSEIVRGHAALFPTLVDSDPEGKAVVSRIVARVEAEDHLSTPQIDVEIVNEKEAEKEQDITKDKEQQIEIEKYVELAYSRDNEQPTPWPLNALSDERRPPFYPLQHFKLYKRRALSFPGRLSVSENFFNPRWMGHRRVKNVIISLEWTPSISGSQRTASSRDWRELDEETALAQLERLMEVVLEKEACKEGKTQGPLGISPSFVKSFLCLALNLDQHGGGEEAVLASPQMVQAMEGLSASLVKVADRQPRSVAKALLGFLSDNPLLHEEGGRHTVAVSLVEAETLRRVIHLRRMLEEPIVENADVGFALRLVPSGNLLIDATLDFRHPPVAYQTRKCFECLRFFDCEASFQPEDLGYLLRSLHLSPSQERKVFFVDVAACKRRQRTGLDRSAVSLLFKQSTPLNVLRHRTLGLLMANACHRMELSLDDAFKTFNSSHSNSLTPAELWAGMRHCSLTNFISATDVLDFVEIADTHFEGSVSYTDFLFMLTSKHDLDLGDEAAGEARRLDDVPPYGEEILTEEAGKRARETREAEEKAKASIEQETEWLMAEIQAEQDRLEFAKVGENPIFKENKEEDAPTFPDIKPDTITQAAKLVTALQRAVVEADPHPTPTPEGAPAAAEIGEAEAKVLRDLAKRELKRVGVVPEKALVNACLRLAASRARAQIPAHAIHFSFEKDKTPLLCTMGAYTAVNVTAPDDLCPATAMVSCADLRLMTRPLRLFVSGYEGEEAEKEKEKKEEGKKGPKEVPVVIPEPLTTDTLAKMHETAADCGVVVDPRTLLDKHGLLQSYSLTVEFQFPTKGKGALKKAIDSIVRHGIGELALFSWNLRVWRFSGLSDIEDEEDTGGRPKKKKAAKKVVASTKNEVALCDAPSHIDGTELCTFNQGQLVEEDVTCAHVSTLASDGTVHEWMKIKAPRPGWLEFSQSGRPMWKQQRAVAVVGSNGEMRIKCVQVEADSGAFDAAEREPLDEDEREQETSDRSDSDGAASSMGGGDDGDWAAAMGVDALMNKMVEQVDLKIGDKVSRGKDWSNENDDGGPGSVGRVIAIEGEDDRGHVTAVQVQWPGGETGTYSTGMEGGDQEIVKVGDADKNENRETVEDDKWRPYRNKTSHNCDSCGKSGLRKGDWFRCNVCGDYDLCKSCFAKNLHIEHEFSDLAKIGLAKGGICEGMQVTFKKDVKKPFHGWQMLPSESDSLKAVGTVMEVNDEDVLVRFSPWCDTNDEEFKAKLHELEAVQEQEEEEDDMVVLEVLEEVTDPLTEWSFKKGSMVRVWMYGAFFCANIRGIYVMPFKRPTEYEGLQHYEKMTPVTHPLAKYDPEEEEEEEDEEDEDEEDGEVDEDGDEDGDEDEDEGENEDEDDEDSPKKKKKKGKKATGEEEGEEKKEETKEDEEKEEAEKEKKPEIPLPEKMIMFDIETDDGDTYDKLHARFVWPLDVGKENARVRVRPDCLLPTPTQPVNPVTKRTMRKNPNINFAACAKVDHTDADGECLRIYVAYPNHKSAYIASTDLEPVQPGSWFYRNPDFQGEPGTGITLKEDPARQKAQAVEEEESPTATAGGKEEEQPAAAAAAAAAAAPSSSSSSASASQGSSEPRVAEVEWIPLPKSVSVVLDQEFLDGVSRTKAMVGSQQCTARFFTDHMHIEGPAQTAAQAVAAQAAAKKGRGNYRGIVGQCALRREPAEQWHSRGKMTQLDDGLWHVATLTVAPDGFSFMIDGRPSNVSVEDAVGPFKSKDREMEDEAADRRRRRRRLHSDSDYDDTDEEYSDSDSEYYDSDDDESDISDEDDDERVWYEYTVKVTEEEGEGEEKKEREKKSKKKKVLKMDSDFDEDIDEWEDEDGSENSEDIPVKIKASKAQAKKKLLELRDSSESVIEDERKRSVDEPDGRGEKKKSKEKEIKKRKLFTRLSMPLDLTSPLSVLTFLGLRPQVVRDNLGTSNRLAPRRLVRWVHVQAGAPPKETVTDWHKRIDEATHWICGKEGCGARTSRLAIECCKCFSARASSDEARKGKIAKERAARDIRALPAGSKGVRRVRERLQQKVRAIWQKAYDARMERLAAGVRTFGIGDLLRPELVDGGGYGPAPYWGDGGGAEGSRRGGVAFDVGDDNVTMII